MDSKLSWRWTGCVPAILQVAFVHNRSVYIVQSTQVNRQPLTLKPFHCSKFYSLCTPAPDQSLMGYSNQNCSVSKTFKWTIWNYMKNQNWSSYTCVTPSKLMRCILYSSYIFLRMQDGLQITLTACFVISMVHKRVLLQQIKGNNSTSWDCDTSSSPNMLKKNIKKEREKWGEIHL